MNFCHFGIGQIPIVDKLVLGRREKNVEFEVTSNLQITLITASRIRSTFLFYLISQNFSAISV